MAGLRHPEKYRRSRGTHWGLLGGIFLLQYGSIGFATVNPNTPQTFLPKGLFSGIPCPSSTAPRPPILCPAIPDLSCLSSKAQPDTYLLLGASSGCHCQAGLFLAQAPATCMSSLRPWQCCWAVCSGLSARGLLQRRGAPIETHSSR